MKRNLTVAVATAAGVAALMVYPTSRGLGLWDEGSSSAGTSTSTTTGDDGSSSDATTGTGSGSSGSSDSGTSSSDSSSSSSGDSGSGSTTYAGDEVQTRWGIVQVQITVEDGKITAAEALQHPTGDHESEEINAYALPILNEEVVDAQSADIDAVSGATVTSDGYITSLQSAIDQANL